MEFPLQKRFKPQSQWKLQRYSLDRVAAFPETKTSQIHWAALKTAAAKEIVLKNIFSGRPDRGIVNRLIREIGPVNTGTHKSPLVAAAFTGLRKKAEARGSGDFSPLLCGQNANGCREISAAELTKLLAAEL